MKTENTLSSFSDSALIDLLSECYWYKASRGSIQEASLPTDLYPLTRKESEDIKLLDDVLTQSMCKYYKRIITHALDVFHRIKIKTHNKTRRPRRNSI